VVENETLPFAIDARLAERGQTVFVASVDGKKITSERYAPGDGKRRREVADLWRHDERLHNGSPVNSAEIIQELERVEHAAWAAADEVANEEAAEAAELTERANYVDDARITELAWNRKEQQADFITYDRHTSKVERTQGVETAAGPLGIPTICKGITTPGGEISGNVLLPDDCDWEGRDEGRLRVDIAGFINRYVELPGDDCELAVEYILLTWIHDSFDELPYMAFRTADIGRGKSRALETVGALCYRALFVGGGSSSAATLRMLDCFGGTLLADEFDQGHNTELAADLNRILCQGFQKRRPLVKCDGEDNAPRPFRCYGPKIFALRGKLGDDAAESRTLSIHMQQRTRPNIPLTLPRRQFDAEALAIRNRLLAWRFANFGQVKIDPTLADPSLEDRLNQIGLPLLAIARTESAQARIIAALHRQESGVAATRAETLAAEVLAAVVAIADWEQVARPGQVAKELNRRRAEVAEVPVDKLGRQTISAHKVGRILSGELELGHDHPPRDEGGARYRLEAKRMVELAKRYGVNLTRTSVERQAQTSAENGLFQGVRAHSDDNDDTDVPTGGGGGLGNNEQTTPPPDTDQPPPEDANWPPVDPDQPVDDAGQDDDAPEPKDDATQEQRPDSDDANLEPEDETVTPVVDPDLPLPEQVQRYRVLADASAEIFPELSEQYRKTAKTLEGEIGSVG